MDTYKPYLAMLSWLGKYEQKGCHKGGYPSAHIQTTRNVVVDEISIVESFWNVTQSSDAAMFRLTIGWIRNLCGVNEIFV